MFSPNRNPLLNRMFRSANVHARPKMTAQRLALRTWAKNGRNISVLTPRDLSRNGGSAGRRNRRSTGSNGDDVQTNRRTAPPAADDDGSALYDGVSNIAGAVPLDKIRKKQKGGDESGGDLPEHGTWEWEREMIRRRAQWSIRRGEWVPPASHAASFGAAAAAAHAKKSPSSLADLDLDESSYQLPDEDGDGDEENRDENVGRSVPEGKTSAAHTSSSSPPQSLSFAIDFPLPTATAEEKQSAFDSFLERALILFARPHRDALSTAEMQQILSRALNKPFLPTMFGSPELMCLLRNSSFLQSHRGKWAFVRQFDPERDNVTVRLEPYRYQEPPSQDEGVRSYHKPESQIKKWS